MNAIRRLSAATSGLLLFCLLPMLASTPVKSKCCTGGLGEKRAAETLKKLVGAMGHTWKDLSSPGAVVKPP